MIAFAGGYHGLGFGAVAATGLPFFREPFRAQLKDFATFLPFPSSAAEIERTIATREIGCILVEPVQGRGGCVVPPREFLPMLRAICDAHKILLIADEIYTGFNRTGALFACEHFGVTPDIICIGKALTALGRRGHVVLLSQTSPGKHLDLPAAFHAGIGNGTTESENCHLVINPELMLPESIAHIISDVFLDWRHQESQRAPLPL